MRVTKAMKEYVESQMSEKRLAINKAYRAEYEARKKTCVAECEEIVAQANARVAEVLRQYNFQHRRGYREEPLVLYEQDIVNESEWSNIQDHERALYHKQQEMMKKFILECDLGVDKEQFYSMVAAISFDE